MSIYIPDSVLTAVTDAFIRLSNETPSLEPVDRLDIVQRALREAWPHLIPAITADLRAQLRCKFIEMDGRLFDVEEPDKTGAIAIRPMVEFDGWCAMQALEEAFDLIAGTEGDDGTE